MPKISALTAATAPDADDLLYIVEDGNSRKATVEQVGKSALNATGNAPIYACRAWVNFNGTGTPAIRASGNVSSITDLGVGHYVINFTTAMPDTSYSVVVSGTGPINVEHCVVFTGAFGTTSFQYNVYQTNNSSLRADDPVAQIAVFR